MEAILGLSALQLVLRSETTLGACRVKCSECKVFFGKFEGHTSIFDYIEQTAPLSMSTDKIRSVYSSAGGYIPSNEAICTGKSRRGISHWFANASKISNGTGRSDCHPDTYGDLYVYAHDLEAVETVSDNQAALRALQAIMFDSEIVLGCHRT
ncbi:hypothetical protein Trydic_g3752 [Trypoxylus dichotomus]